ncbi:MAG: thioredoxin [Clostridiaceae bacterium]|nr:thioredoxin [Clostridiaceae bacterium]
MNITSENFETEILKFNGTVLVDFWADWCMPCKMMMPIITEVEEELKDKIKVCKVNIDEQGELATRFEIMSIPTFLIFKNGKVVSSVVGMRSKSEIINLLK